MCASLNWTHRLTADGQSPIKCLADGLASIARTGAIYAHMTDSYNGQEKDFKMRFMSWLLGCGQNLSTWISGTLNQNVEDFQNKSVITPVCPQFEEKEVIMDEAYHIKCEHDGEELWWAGEENDMQAEADDDTAYELLADAIEERGNIPRKYKITIWRQGLSQVTEEEINGAH